VLWAWLRCGLGLDGHMACPYLCPCAGQGCASLQPHTREARGAASSVKTPLRGVGPSPGTALWQGRVLVWRGKAAPAAGDVWGTWGTLVLSRLKDLHPRGAGPTLAGLSCPELRRCSAGEEAGASRQRR